LQSGSEGVLGFAALAVLGCGLVASTVLYLVPARNDFPTARRSFPGNPRRQALGGLAVFVGLVALMHPVENWRGRREWERVKAELTAQGESLDYTSFLKPPVPDDQDVMAHPFMKAHFMKGSRQVSAQHPPFERTGAYGYPYTLEDLKKLPRKRAQAESVTALVGDVTGRETIPHLQFKNQPLAEVVAELGRQAGVNLAPAAETWPWGSHTFRKVWVPALVTVSYTNVTAIEALERLAEKHMLKPDTARWHREKVLAFLPNRMSLQEILDWFEQYRSDFDQLEEALQRPYSRLTPNRLRPDQSSIPGFVSFRTVAQSYASLCKVHLLLGDADAALKDLRILRRLADAVQANEPPTLVEAMIKVAMTGMLSQALEETMAERLWPDTHLGELQKLTGNVDMLGTLATALRGERAAILQKVDTVSQEGTARLIAKFPRMNSRDEGPEVNLQEQLAGWLVPKGWIDQNKARYARLMQGYIPGLGVGGQRVDLGKLDEAHTANVAALEGFRPYNALINIALPKSGAVAAKNQCHASAAYLACALERHRAAKGAYPERLEELVPDFAAAIPKDVFDGQPLRYRRTDDGKYLLYSIGSNIKDDGGVATLDKDGKPESGSATGDWVWQGVPK